MNIRDEILRIAKIPIPERQIKRYTVKQTDGREIEYFDLVNWGHYGDIEGLSRENAVHLVLRLKYLLGDNDRSGSQSDK